MTHTRWALLRRFSRCSLAVAITVGVSSTAIAQARYSVDQPEQSLADALREAGKTTRVNLVFDPALVAGKTAKALAGELSAEEALSALLSGTGLVARKSAEHTLIILRREEAESSDATTDENNGDDSDKLGQKLEVISVSGEKARGFRTNLVQVGAFRDANILDVPLTINVIPRALLESQDAQGLFDALKNSAGVTRSVNAGSVADNLAIRGIDINNRTSYRLNGGLPINNLIDLPLENKERIEALKGSSALYYGFTSPGGVINMVTKRATVDAITTVSYGGNQFGQWLAAIDVGRKFGENDRFGLRVNGVYGKLRNPVDGYSGDRFLGAFAADWRATDSLVFKLDFEKIRKNAVEQASIAVLPAVNGIVSLPNIPDPTKLLSGTWALWRGRAQNEALRTDYQINDRWAITAEAGRAVTYRDERASTQVRDYSVVTGAGTLQSLLTRGQKYANTNYRLELAGRFDALFDQEVILGFMENKRWQNAPSQQTFNTPQNLYDPVSIMAPVYTLVPVFSVSDVRDNGFYLLDRIRFTERWQLLAGARRADYTNESVASNVITKTAVKKMVSSLGLIYKPWNHTSVHASYIEGLEEGATAGTTVVNAFQILPPGVSKQNELGIRTEAIKGVSAAVAAFTLERATTYINAANVFVLDGRSEYKGVEYAFIGEVAPRVSVYISGLFLNARQNKAANASLIDRTPENTPKQSHSLFAEYNPKLVPGLSVNAGAFYTAKRPVNAANEAFIPGYTIFTVGVRYSTRLAGRSTSFQVNVENAADKRYFSAVGSGTMGVGLPRTVKFSVKVNL